MIPIHNLTIMRVIGEPLEEEVVVKSQTWDR